MQVRLTYEYNRYGKSVETTIEIADAATDDQVINEALDSALFDSDIARIAIHFSRNEDRVHLFWRPPTA